MKRKWSKEQLENAIETSFSYRKVLSKIDLKQAGGNYQQLRKYIKEFGFKTSHFKGRT